MAGVVVPMMKDVLVSLTDDHVVLSWIAHRLHTTQDPVARERLFNELAKALGGHLSALEDVVLPALSRSGWAGIDLQVVVEHMVLKHHLAELLTMARRSDAFETGCSALCERIEAQAQREQMHLLPAVRKGLDEGERAMLAIEVEAHLGAYLSELRTPGAHRDAEPSTAEQLLEDAQLVLASLPCRGT
jgi:hypothetical protein